jgi:hypothetical protein
MAKVYKMVAVSGDMSSNGMSDTAAVITLTAKQLKIAKEFLAFQKHFQQEFPALFKEQIQSGKLNSKLTELANTDQTLTNKMFDFGIFTTKYDARTSWDIVA